MKVETIIKTAECTIYPFEHLPNSFIKIQHRKVGSENIPMFSVEARLDYDNVTVEKMQEIIQAFSKALELAENKLRQ